MSDRNSRGDITKQAGSKRLAYTLAAGAAVALSQSESAADILYSGIQDIAIGQGLRQPIQFDTDEFVDIYLKNYIFAKGNYQGVTVPFFPGKVAGFLNSPNEYVTALTPGTLVDSTTVGPTFYGSLSYGANNPNGQFNEITDGYIGLSFPIGDFMHYAWIRVDINNAAGTFLIRDWAWEGNPGTGIAVGDKGSTLVPGDFNLDGKVDGLDFLLWQRGGSPSGTTPADLQDWQSNYGAGTLVAATSVVPEPITLGLLACGAAGLAMLRTRNR